MTLKTLLPILSVVIVSPMISNSGLVSYYRLVLKPINLSHFGQLYMYRVIFPAGALLILLSTRSHVMINGIALSARV